MQVSVQKCSTKESTLHAIAHGLLGEHHIEYLCDESKGGEFRPKHVISKF